MVDLYAIAIYNIYSLACCGGLVMMLCVVHVGADCEVKGEVCICELFICC